MTIGKAKKHLVRQATVIHERLMRSPSARAPNLPHYAWKRVSDVERQLRLAETKSWQTAAEQLRIELRSAAGYLARDAARLEAELQSAARPSVTLREVYLDLVALRDEFEEPHAWNHEAGVLTLTTAPITLEQVYLGPFRIHLCVGPGEMMDYEIEAVDPHPAARDDSITHPHVQGRTLCEGDGKHAIRAALVQGRLYDFFVLVRQVLQTYGADTAYVTLDRWRGSSCADCDEPFYRDEDADICSRCSAEVCQSCRSSCGECGDSLCSQCVSQCAVCDSVLCRSCAQRCRICSRPVCGACLQEGHRCEVCHEEDESHSPASDTTDSAV